MTPQEALNKLDETVLGDLEWKVVLTEALKKQIPQKVVHRSAETIGVYSYDINLCPACDGFVSRYVPNTQRNCHICGQALDWGDAQ